MVSLEIFGVHRRTANGNLYKATNESAVKSFNVTFEVLGSVVLNIEANTIDDARKIARAMKNTSCIKELEDAYIGKALIFEEQNAPVV